MSDVIKYIEALPKFLTAIQDTAFLSSGNYKRSLEGLSSALKIARIEIDREEKKSVEDFLENKDDVDTERAYIEIKSFKNAPTITYTFYQVKGEADWTSDEKIWLQTIANLLFSYNSQHQYLKKVEFNETHDPRFKNINNLNVAIGFLEKLLKKGTAKYYTIAYFNIHNFAKVYKTLGEEGSTICLEKYFEGLQEILGDIEDAGVVAAVESDIGLVVYKKDLHIHFLSYFRETEINLSEYIKKAKNPASDERVVLSAHVGVALGDMEFSSAKDIVEAARAALNVSRKMVGSNVVFYDNDFREKFELQKQIEDWFEEALKREEFLIYYQPKVDLRDYSLSGAEALVRWMHEGQMIFPNNFIPSLESNYTIKYLDIYMLTHVCADIAKWIDQEKNVPTVSVNLSRASLTIPNLVGLITRTIDSYKIPRSLIQIELTESASYTSNDELQKLVFGLSENGISTAVDDFGTGFSSLSLIRELPWSVLKIDKSILQGAQKAGSREQKMFKSIVSMAHEIGLECIVEGVETRDDVRILKEVGCFYAQGFYFSRPVPKEEFEKKIPMGEIPKTVDYLDSESNENDKNKENK